MHPAETAKIDYWRRAVLKAEGLTDWRIEIAADDYCCVKDKVIQLPVGASASLFLHVVAHALHPEPEGPMANRYHGGVWASVFGALIDKYMVVREGR